MKKKMTRLLIISGLLAAGGLNAVAQEKEPAKVPTDGTFKLLGAKAAFAKVVKGAPYSATATTETIQTLSDGNQIIRKNESKLYRDGEGRIRIEQTLETIGKWAAEEVQHVITINDPVTGVSYTLNPRTRTAIKNVFAPQLPPGEAQNKVFKIGDKIVTQAEFEAAMEKKRRAQEELLATRGKEALDDSELKKKLGTLQTGKTDTGEKKTESLGTQTMEGVTAEGTRSTLTIPAGEIGNTRPLEIVDESWYSPELQITVMTKHRDPRSGETTYRLTNLNRSEPDRSLFEVPADYTVRDNKMPAPAKLRRREEQ